MSSQEDINPDSSPESPNAPPMSPKQQQDAMLEPKPTPKMIRVLTVMAYVLSVSMAAILLSIYYIFMWEGKPHLGARIGRGGYEENLSTHHSVGGPTFMKYQDIHPKINDTGNSVLSHSAFSEPTTYADGFIPHRITMKTDEYNTVANIADFENNTIVNNATSDVETLNETLDSIHTPSNITNTSAILKMQQFTAAEAQQPEEGMVSASPPSEENVTWSDDYDSLEEFRKSSILMKKLMNGY